MTEKTTRFFIASSVALTTLLLIAAMAGCGSDSALELPIKGTLSYDSTTALPADASARVSLVERGSDKTDKRIVAERSLHDLGASPIKFQLQIAQHLINPNGQYGMRAAILDAQGDYLWQTKGTVALDPQEKNNTVSLDLKEINSGQAADESERSK